MLAWAVFFLIAAAVAALFGFGGIATAFASVAQLLFYIFVIIFLAVLVAHALRRPPGGSDRRRRDDGRSPVRKAG